MGGKNTKCICDIEKYTIQMKCPICDRTSLYDVPKNERVQHCTGKNENHPISLCGFPKTICHNCQDRGWYSTHGQASSGGEFINEITGESMDDV